MNPYIAPNSEQRATRHYDLVGHLRWSMSKKLEANAEVSYSWLNDDLTFMLDDEYSLQNVYRPLYLDNNRLTLGADIAFVNDEMLTLRAGGHYYHYNYTGLGVAGDTWVKLYRPKWDALLAADVNYNDKWLFHLEGRLLGKMQGDNGEELPMRYGIPTTPPPRGSSSSDSPTPCPPDDLSRDTRLYVCPAADVPPHRRCGL